MKTEVVLIISLGAESLEKSKDSSSHSVLPGAGDVYHWGTLARFRGPMVYS